mgnify:CR=1 FL=1
MDVIEYGRNNRPFMWSFEKYLYRQLNPLCPSITDTDCEKYLGRNFSYFIFDKYKNTYGVLLDSSDGSGAQPHDDSLKLEVWDKILKRNNVKDFIIFKMQCGANDIFNEYYPLPSSKTFPLGYFTDVPDWAYGYKKAMAYYYFARPKDIDFFWAGTIDYTHEPWAWPKKKDIRHWQPGQRIEGYKILKDIKERHPEWNIIISDKPQYPKDVYLDMIMRSKVCIELPGIGGFTTRFFENLILGKCILSRKLLHQLPYELKEDFHYASMGPDFSKMEERMEELINNPREMYTIETNTRLCQKYLTHEYAYENMVKVMEEQLWGK